MATSDAYRLRWKGAITGPFPLSRVTEMLRTGEISLLHNIEVDGSRMTVRDYFRSIGMSRAPSASAAAETDAPPPPGAELPLGEPLTPDALRNAAGESLERPSARATCGAARRSCCRRCSPSWSTEPTSWIPSCRGR